MTNPSSSDLTLREILKRAFPDGTQLTSQKSWDQPPFWPPDVFGICAYLLDTSGEYAKFNPALDSSGRELYDIDYIKSLVKVGESWRNDKYIFAPPPKKVVELWRALFSKRNAIYFSGKWWETALALLIIADEACDYLGHRFERDPSLPGWMHELYQQSQTKGEDAKGKDRSPLVYSPSLCFFADADVFCVQPKSRTPQVGCSLRNFSHNLALLPPRGNVRALWADELGGSDKEGSSDVLNLLLVPFPFHVKGTQFKPTKPAQDTKDLDVGSHFKSIDQWGNFGIAQEWLLDTKRPSRQKLHGRFNLLRLCIELIEAAQKDCTEVHGLVFPEYALDWESYELLISVLFEKYKSLKFIVSGSSSNCSRNEERRHGNCVLTACNSTANTLLLGEDTQLLAESTPSGPQIITTSRRKHHRWRLDKAQIENYGLGAALDSRRLWWEGLRIEQRELYVNTFGEFSTFCALICEELARTDPVHNLLRAMAPNLVFALLMDGPQIPERWSSRYALGLTEDPGSSVLTLTSLALIERSNMNRPNGSRSIALWRDDMNRCVTIECPKGAMAVILTLSENEIDEYTIDGRQNRGAKSWRLSSHHPVKLVPLDNKTRELVKWADANNH